MASFLSNPTQFTPYRDPFNLQLYAQIGTQKQSAYQSGIERVQGVYDTVAGLKMGRPEDTEYLNQKLAGLQTNIQKLAGSDFSQANVVSQAAGYASQIYNDQRIVKDVISAQNASDAQNQIQEAKKSGKSAASNDNAVIRNIVAWQQGGADASLGKQQYTPYYNYAKSWQDFMSGKHGNVIIEETPNARGLGGVAYTLNQGKREYLDSATVQADFQTFLQMDAQAQGQVQLDALYYSDRTPNEVALSSLTRGLQQQLASYDESLELLEQQKAINTSTQDRNRTNDKIRAINDQKAKLNLRINNGDIEREFYDNPEGAKMNLFLQGLSVGAGNRYAYSQIENKTVKNPEYDALLDSERLQISYAELDIKKSAEKRAIAKEDREARQTALESQGGVPQFVVGPTEVNTPATPEMIIQQNRDMGRQVFHEQLEVLYNTGNMSSLVTLGQDAAGNPVYNLAPGKTNEDFQSVWSQMKDQYYKNPNGAKPSMKRYMMAEDDENSGLGREKIYFANNRSISKIENELDRENSSNTNYQEYKRSLSNLGDLNQVLLTENGQTVTRNDLVKFANAINQDKSYSGRNEANIIKNSGLTTEKVRLILRRGTGELEGFGDVGRAILSAGMYNPSDRQTGGIGEEYFKIEKALNSLNSDIYKQRQERFKNLIPELQATVMVTGSLDGANKKQLEDRIAQFRAVLSDPTRAAELEKFNSVTNARNKGENTPQISIGAEKNPVTGRVVGFVQNSATNEKAYVDLGPDNARLMFASLTQPNPNAVINTELNANRPVRGAASITSSYRQPKQSNLQNYSVRYKIADDGKGNYYPSVEFYRSGTNDWQELPETQYFPSIEQAREMVEEMVKYGDAIFEKYI